MHTIGDVEAVCSDGSLRAEDVLGLLAGLVDRSLVLTEPEGAGTRYRLLETTREYALELLDAADEAAASRARRRFAQPVLQVGVDPSTRSEVVSASTSPRRPMVVAPRAWGAET